MEADAVILIVLVIVALFVGTTCVIDGRRALKINELDKEFLELVRKKFWDGRRKSIAEFTNDDEKRLNEITLELDELERKT